MQGGQIQAFAPELRFGLHEVQLCIAVLQHPGDAVDMVMVTVGKQDIGNAHTVTLCQRQHLGHIPGRIDHGGAATGMIMNQVDEILHRPEFQGMDGKGFVLRHPGTSRSVRACADSMIDSAARRQAVPYAAATARVTRHDMH